jgi:antirestriction protein
MENTETKQTKAELMAEENGLTVEINQAYIDNVGEEYATAENCEEAYAGEFDSDEDFAQDMAEQVGAIDKDAKWPQTCIDWEQASKELMWDYFEQDGYYFRNS